MYRGRFDSGWADYARRTLDNQLRMGIVPEGTELPIPNKNVEDWDSLTVRERSLYARQMECFAGFMSETDHELGRLIEFLRRIGELDNTLIMIALGDNGPSGEGGRVGYRDMPVEEEEGYIDSELALLDHYGDELTWPFYPMGWAQACATPFRYYKKWADYEGGTHDGLIVHYPAGNLEKGGIRTQYTHVVDMLPTTVEMTGSTLPKTINGYKQTELEGVSFAYAITAPDNNVTDRKKIQYYEMNSSYALYKDGWKVQFPNGKVKRMLMEFDRLARKYNVYPLKNGKVADPDYPAVTRTHYDVYTGARSWAEYPYFDGSEGKPYTVSVHIDECGKAPEGMLASQKDWALYVLEGYPVYATANGDRLVAGMRLPEGAAVVKAVATHKGKKTTIALYVDDVPAGSMELSSKVNIAPKSNAFQVGRSWGVPVNKDYSSPFYFTGSIFKAAIDVER